MDNRERALAREAAQRLLNEAEIHKDLDPNVTQFAQDIDIVSRFVLGEARAAIEGEPSDMAMERLNEQWKARCLVLMGDKDKLKAEIEQLRAERVLEAEPRELQEPKLSSEGGMSGLSHPAIMRSSPSPATDKQSIRAGEQIGLSPFVPAAAAPLPTALQRTAGDVIRQFRESGSEDWGELESAINWWAMNDFCPNFTKGDGAEGRLRDALNTWLAETIVDRQIDNENRDWPAVNIADGEIRAYKRVLAALESA